MRAAWQIVYKLLVKQFYIQHAGMFLFAFIFFFGIVDGGHLISYHRSLMLSMISLPLFLFIVMLVWLLYNIKTILYCSKAISSTDAVFIYRLRALPAASQLLLYAGTGILLCFPVLLYSVALAVFSFGISPAVTWQVVLWQLLMITIHTFSLFTFINRNPVSAFTHISAFLQKAARVETGYNGFILSYIFNEKKISFLIAKSFSLLLLGMLLVRNGDSFDADLFAIFFPLCIMAHATLVFYCVDFNESYLHIHRNLPIHWSRTALMFCFTWIIILLPEVFFLFINNNGNLPVMQLVMQSMTAVAVLFIFTGTALGCSLNMERYLLFAFMVYIAILILQKAFGHVIAAGFIALLAGMVFRSHYYSFEREQLK